MREVKSCDMRGMPWSEVMFSGTPKRLIHPNMKANAHGDEDAFNFGTASNQRTDLSMVVKRYWEPSEGGMELTISM